MTATAPLGKHVELTIYFRPNGDPAAGHPQVADLATFASIANGKPSADFPREWAIVVNHGVAVFVDEGSGIHGDPSCITTDVTRRFINS